MLWFSFLFLSLFWCQRQLLDWDFRIGNCNRRAKKRERDKKKGGKDVEEGKKGEKRKTDKEGKQEKFYLLISQE